MMKKLLILSGKGGTGKTTVASALIKISQVQAFADCDIDAPNLHLVMQMKSQPIMKDFYALPKASLDQDKCIGCGLCYEHCRFESILKENGKYYIDFYACEGCSVCDYVCPTGAIDMKAAKAGNLTLYKDEKIFSTAKLSMGSGTSGLLVTEVKKQLTENAPDKDLAIIDGSPGIGCPVIASITGVDMVLLVAEPSVTGISDMLRILELAKKFQVKLAVCVNKYDINLAKTREIEEYCLSRGINYLAGIPFDQMAVEAVNQGLTIADFDCPSGRALKKIYNEIKEMGV